MCILGHQRCLMSWHVEVVLLLQERYPKTSKEHCMARNQNLNMHVPLSSTIPWQDKRYDITPKEQKQNAEEGKDLSKICINNQEKTKKA